MSDRARRAVAQATTALGAGVGSRARRLVAGARARGGPAISAGVRDLAGRARRRTAPAGPYAPERFVTDPAGCYWYHTMEVPGIGLVTGEWDLRGGVDAYLGGVPLEGKRVLEIGTASGFLCLEMERRGAEVVACDLSPAHEWDAVPMAGVPPPRVDFAALNNSWWFARRALGGRARVVYSSVYELPESIGRVQVATFGSVLLHLRDPFLALQKALALTDETVIVTDLAGDPIARGEPRMTLIPDHAQRGPLSAWWYLPPELMRRFVGILGFERTEITTHTQRYRGEPCELYTLVGHRTRPWP